MLSQEENENENVRNMWNVNKKKDRNISRYKTTRNSISIVRMIYRGHIHCTNRYIRALDHVDLVQILHEKEGTTFVTPKWGKDRPFAKSSDIPVDVGCTKAEADATRAKRARICFIMVTGVKGSDDDEKVWEQMARGQDTTSSNSLASVSGRRREGVVCQRDR
jgi:hypothetical protein